jgi:cystathionine beta-lyase/cystathionine gamma-synthase
MLLIKDNFMLKNTTIAQDYNSMEEYWADYELINQGKSPNTYWDTYENGSRRMLESWLATIYGSEASLFLNSGMAAIQTSLESQVLCHGDKILIGQKSYFETIDWLEKFVTLRGIELIKVDTSNSHEIMTALRFHRPKICFLETVINSPDVICLDFDNKFFEISQKTFFVIDNTVQSHLTKWFEIVPKKYHNRLLVVESGTKYITDQIMMGIIYGSLESLEKPRNYARCIGNQLQQKAFDYFKPVDFEGLSKKLGTQNKNVEYLINKIDPSKFQYIRTLNQNAKSVNQKMLFSKSMGCLVFLKLQDCENLESKHRQLVNSIKQKMTELGFLIHIRAGFGYSTTCLRSYEDNALNQADKPLYVRISVGVESEEYFRTLAKIINQISYEL